MKKISPEEYRKILNGIDLKNILLKEVKASIEHKNFSENIKISIKDKASYKNEEDELVITHTYTLTAKGKAKKPALKISGTYIVVFESNNEINDGFFNIYKETSLPLNVWPFFRELVNSTTSRMNIPPLTLPLLKR